MREVNRALREITDQTSDISVFSTELLLSEPELSEYYVITFSTPERKREELQRRLLEDLQYTDVVLVTGTPQMWVIIKIPMSEVDAAVQLLNMFQ
jgi:hypothetical protein